MTNPVSALRSGIECGACDHSNSEAAQFCAGCGQALFEACGSCSQPVRLDQKFCGGCGSDLQQKRDRLREQHAGWLASSVKGAKLCEFDKSIGLLNRIAADNDYRYRDLGRQAAAALQKIEKLRGQRTQAVEEIVASAQVAMQNDDKSAVVELLSRVPEAMRTPEIRQMLESCSTFVAQVNELEAAMQKQLAEKNYDGVAGTIDVLLGLIPGCQRYLKLGRQVAGKLLSSSQRRFDRQDYAGAASKLSAVPTRFRDERYETTRQMIESVQVAGAAVRCGAIRDIDAGSVSCSIRKGIATQRESQVEYERTAAQNQTAAPRFSQSVQCVARYVRELGGRQSRLPRLSDAHCCGKKLNSCWGIDIGTSGLRAVLLQSNNEELTILESYSKDFDAPVSRVGNEASAADTIRDAVTKFLEASTNKESPYWVNLPAGEIISRFVRLPPVKDKKAYEMLTMEAQQRIPMPPETLDCVTWIGKLDSESSHGRPAFVCAAKKAAVSSRTDIMAAAG